MKEGYRWRRGILVKIPTGWVGQTTHPQTIRKRQSKQPRKNRRFTYVLHKGHPDASRGRLAEGAGSRTHADRAAIADSLDT